MSGAPKMSGETPPRAPPLRVFHSGGRYLVWEPQHILALRARHRLVGALVGALPAHKGQTAERGAPLSLSFEEALLAAEEGIVEVSDLDKEVSPPAEPASVPAGRAGGSAGGGVDGRAAMLGALDDPRAGFITVASACTGWQGVALPPLTPVALRLAHGGRLLHASVFRALWSAGYFVTTGLKFGGDFLCYAADPMSCHAVAIVRVMGPDELPLRRAERACAGRLAAAARKIALLASADGDAGDIAFCELDAQLEPVPFQIERLCDWDFDDWKRVAPEGSRAPKRPRGDSDSCLELPAPLDQGGVSSNK